MGGGGQTGMQPGGFPGGMQQQQMGRGTGPQVMMGMPGFGM